MEQDLNLDGADVLEFETQTDILTLLENVKCQGINQSGLKQALGALSTLCSSNVESQDYFRLAGGVKEISKLLENNSCPRSAIPAALFCLASAVNKNVSSQNSILNEQFFSTVQQFLANEDEKIVNSAAFLLTCVVAYNGRGQQLAEETGCLKELLNILRGFLCDSQANDKQWLIITTAIATCINNPQNERNQGICCSVLPLALKFLSSGSEQPQNSGLCHIMTLISCLVANNTPNQNRLRQCGGLEELTKFIKTLGKNPADLRTSTIVLAVSALDACIADNASSGIEVGNMGMTSVILKYVDDFNWETADLKRLLSTVGRILESHKRFSYCLTERKTYNCLVKLLTTSQDEELFKILKYIFTFHREKDKAELLDLEDSMDCGAITRNCMDAMNEKFECLVQNENPRLKMNIPKSNSTVTHQKKSDNDLQQTSMIFRENASHKKQIPDSDFFRGKYSACTRDSTGLHPIRRLPNSDHGVNMVYAPCPSVYHSGSNLRSPQLSFNHQSTSKLAGNSSLDVSSMIGAENSLNVSDNLINRGHETSFDPKTSNTDIKNNKAVRKNHASFNNEATQNWYKGNCFKNQAQVSDAYNEKIYYRGKENKATMADCELNNEDCDQQNIGPDASFMHNSKPVLPYTNSSNTLRILRNPSNHFEAVCALQPATCNEFHCSSSTGLDSPVHLNSDTGQESSCYQSASYRHQRSRGVHNYEQPESGYTSGGHYECIDINHSSNKNIHDNCSNNNISENLHRYCFNNHMHLSKNTVEKDKVDCPMAACSSDDHSNQTFGIDRNDNCANPVKRNHYHNDNEDIESNCYLSHTNKRRGTLDNNSNCSDENPTFYDPHRAPFNQINGIGKIGILYENQLNLLKHFQALSGRMMSHISGAFTSNKTVCETSQAAQTVDINNFSSHNSPKQRETLNPKLTSPLSSSRLKEVTKSPVKNDSSHSLGNKTSSSSPEYFFAQGEEINRHNNKNAKQTTSPSSDSFQSMEDRTDNKIQNGVNKRIPAIIDKKVQSSSCIQENGSSAANPSQPQERAFVKPKGVPRKSCSDLKAPIIRHAGTPQSSLPYARMKPTPSPYTPKLHQPSLTQPPASPALSTFDLSLQEIALDKKTCLMKSASFSSSTRFTTPRKTHCVPVKDLKTPTPKILFSLMKVNDVNAPNTPPPPHSSTSEFSSQCSETLQLSNQVKLKTPIDDNQQAPTTHSPVCYNEVNVPRDVLQCPGCAPGPNLNSRTFNIAIETSPNTCLYHRAVRQAERDEIRERLKSLRNSGSYKDVDMNSPSPPKIKSDVYNFSSESEERLSSPCLDESIRSVQKALKKRALKKSCLGQVRRSRVPYSDEEVANLQEGVRKMGQHWQQILFTYNFHPSRTSIDLKDKYRKLNRNEIKQPYQSIPFSMCEIRRLKRGVKTFGYNWKAILAGSKFLPGRTARALRDKWKQLNKVNCN